MRQAEEPLHSVEEKRKLSRLKKAVAPLPVGPTFLPDTQRSRELRPEPLTPTKWTRPRKGNAVLHLFLLIRTTFRVFISPLLETPRTAVQGAHLPLLGPKLTVLAFGENVIAQPASTIDYTHIFTIISLCRISKCF